MIDTKFWFDVWHRHFHENKLLKRILVERQSVLFIGDEWSPECKIPNRLMVLCIWERKCETFAVKGPFLVYISCVVFGFHARQFCKPPLDLVVKYIDRFEPQPLLQHNKVGFDKLEVFKAKSPLENPVLSIRNSMAFSRVHPYLWRPTSTTSLADRKRSPLI